MLRGLCGALALLASVIASQAASEYTIDGTFEGCEHDKLYPLVGAGILECREYQYFYAYRPAVIADGRQVLTIGDNQVSAVLHNGSVYETKVTSEFNGCDFDKTYRFDNGLIFQCATYSYSYSYRPDVRIFVVEGRQPVVQIKGKVYKGQLFKSR